MKATCVLGVSPFGCSAGSHLVFLYGCMIQAVLKVRTGVVKVLNCKKHFGGVCESPYILQNMTSDERQTDRQAGRKVDKQTDR